jgi:hypothetical protein
MADKKMAPGHGGSMKNKLSDKVAGTVGKTALYTYLDETLKSPRLRRMLHEALEQAQEVEVARRA